MIQYFVIKFILIIFVICNLCSLFQALLEVVQSGGKNLEICVMTSDATGAAKSRMMEVSDIEKVVAEVEKEKEEEAAQKKKEKSEKK